MTGYGKGEARLEKGKIFVEVRTVNHRFIDFSTRLPRALGGYEREVERIARRRLKRGHIYITVTFDKSFETGSLGINRRFLRSAYRTIAKFAKEEGIPGEVDIKTLLFLPEAFGNETEEIPPTRLWAAVRKAFCIALDRCVEMRIREGKELLKGIAGQLELLERTTARIEKRAPAALKRSLARTKKRLMHLLSDGNAIDESRWAAEAAIMVDRSDFSEEIVRLKSHLYQFRNVLKKGGEVSKKMTFILQEIHREATTMGNKAADSVIIRCCMAIKGGAEKIREQVQNVE
ncbi:MAG: YicC family protein [Candidatus Krumholzibacteria bacterium]|nr:YicC family protein [Candidatus Krumholzibacteria bacterium]